MLNDLKSKQVCITPTVGLSYGKIKGKLVDYDENFVKIIDNKNKEKLVLINSIYTVEELK